MKKKKMVRLNGYIRIDQDAYIQKIARQRSTKKERISDSEIVREIIDFHKLNLQK